MRKFWFKPNTLGNGLLWLVGLAMELSGWVSQTIAYVLLGVAFVWSIVTFLYWFKLRKRESLTKERIQSKFAIGVLIGRSNGGKVSHSYFKGKITVRGKPEEVDVGGLIGQSENTEVVDSSANAEIECKQD